jgi:hypothetical protein
MVEVAKDAEFAPVSVNPTRFQLDAVSLMLDSTEPSYLAISRTHGLGWRSLAATCGELAAMPTRGAAWQGAEG